MKNLSHTILIQGVASYVTGSVITQIKPDDDQEAQYQKEQCRVQNIPVDKGKQGRFSGEIEEDLDRVPCWDPHFQGNHSISILGLYFLFLFLLFLSRLRLT